jgi:acetyl-CoA synthetase
MDTETRDIDTLLLEERRYEPSPEFAAQANAQPDIYDRDFEEFWESEGRERVAWFEPFTKVYEWDPPYAKWYLGGKLNVAWNCLDKHVEAGRGDVAAYHWEGEPEGDRRRRLVHGGPRGDQRHEGDAGRSPRGGAFASEGA